MPLFIKVGRFATLLLSLTLALQAHGDIVFFKNGDRLQGDILTMADGQLLLQSPMLGDVTIAINDIRSFETTGIKALHLNDGSVLKQAVNTGLDGRINLVKNTNLPAQVVLLSQLDSVNPRPTPKAKWQGNVALGLDIKRGNTAADDVNASVQLSKETEQDRIALSVDYELNQQENGTGEKETSKRRVELEANYDYFVAQDLYVYGNGKLEQEATANLDLRVSIGGGVGYRWFKTVKHELNVESGLNWVNESFTNGTVDSEYLAARFAGSYTRQLTKSMLFFSDLEWIVSVEDTNDQLISGETGLRSNLSDNLFIETKIKYDWDQTPAAGSQRDDIRYLLNVGWGF